MYGSHLRLVVWHARDVVAERSGGDWILSGAARDRTQTQRRYPHMVLSVTATLPHARSFYMHILGLCVALNGQHRVFVAATVKL